MKTNRLNMESKKKNTNEEQYHLDIDLTVSIDSTLCVMLHYE